MLFGVQKIEDDLVIWMINNAMETLVEQLEASLFYYYFKNYIRSSQNRGVKIIRK